MDTVTHLLNPHRPPRVLCGLDVGQMVDPTAMAIAEREMILGPNGRLEPRFLFRFLERVPLRTPYPVVVRGTRKRLAAVGEPVSLIVDVTGVGRGIVDMFRDPVSAEVQREEWALHPTWKLPRSLMPIALTFTRGLKPQQDAKRWDEWHVPRLTLIMALIVALQQHRVHVVDTEEARILIKEAQHFRLNQKQATDSDEYLAWRENEHDDLLFAAAMVVWWGEKYAPVSAAGVEPTRYAIPAGNPLHQASGHVSQRVRARRP